MMDTNQSTNGDSRKAPGGIGRKVALAFGIIVAFFVMIALMDAAGWLLLQLANMLRSLLGLKV